MAKQSGLGDNFFLSGYDLSGDINSLSRISGGNSPLVVTGIDKSAFERIGGKRDGAMEFISYFNDAAGQAHPRLSTLPRTDVLATYCRSTTLGKPAASLVSKQIGYDGTRAADGALTFNCSALANGYGLEWGLQLTAGKRTDTSATEGTGVDFLVGSTTFGAQFYLHAFSFVGTDVTVKIQESSDNGVGDAWADVTGGGFTQIVAGPTSQRIATATNLTVERYLRAVTVTTGGFTSLVFSVMACRNATATVF